MTPSETFRIKGNVTPEQAEVLLNLADTITLQGIGPRILGDAASCYPDEDFMQDLIVALGQVLRRASAQNPLKESLKMLLEKAEELQLEVHRASEYGREQLREAEQILEKFNKCEPQI